MTRAVSNTLTTPDGRPITGRTVSIQLNVPAFTGGGAVEVLRTGYATTDQAGVWTATLDVNANLDPPGTFYTVRETPGVIWTFVVPAGAGPISLRACLVSSPSNPNPMQAGIPFPPGGTAGQVLQLQADGSVAWVTLTGGSQPSPNLVFGAGVYGAGVYSPAA